MVEENNFRLNRMEADIAELKELDKVHTKDLIEIAKSNIRGEASMEKVLDGLKHLTDVTTAITADVTAIKDKPAKNYETIKGILLVVAITNILGILFVKYAPIVH